MVLVSVIREPAIILVDLGVLLSSKAIDKRIISLYVTKPSTEALVPTSRTSVSAASVVIYMVVPSPDAVLSKSFCSSASVISLAPTTDSSVI